MGRSTTGLPLSSEDPITVRQPKPHQASDHASRMKNDPGDGTCHPERISDFMMAIGVQDNVNLQTDGIMRPGAVHVRPSSNATDDGDDTYLDINEDISNRPIEAHLASDEADMEAILEARWAARIAQRLEESTRQERNQTREISPDRADDIVVVADEVKDVRTDSGQKKRRKRIMAIMLLLLVVGGVAAFLMLQNQKDNPVDGPGALSVSDAPSNEPSVAPSFSPVPVDPLVEEMRSWIAPNREDLTKFLDPASPQSQALAWLQDDPITLTPGRSTRTVLERYVLAVLYYSTSGPSWRDDYLSDDDVCTWNNGRPATNDTESLAGVYCVDDGESIGTLALSENNLRGSLPWELALLTSLEVLDVGLNSLTGSIPTQIIDLNWLRVLIIQVNSLTGPIPAEISKLTRLEIFLARKNGLTGTLPTSFSPVTVEIDLGTNRLKGPIPESWWTTMPALIRLLLRENSLTGSLPSTLDRLSNLRELLIYDNLLTGPLPTTFPASTVSIYLDQNNFSGSIPNTWGGNMSNLSSLSLHTNSLTGTIPPSLFAGLTNLSYFAAGDNFLSGPLPASFSVSVDVVNLENNDFKGTIPSTWGDSMPSLSSLAINGNSLTGTVPLSLGQITTLKTFIFHSNSLTGSVDVLCDVGNWASLEADCPVPVTCSCCTTCHEATR